jgi:chromosome segregation ATPase
MRRNVSGFLLIVFGTCLAASTALAAEDPPTHNDLAEINATLKEIARTLKQQVQTQKADLILKRLTLATTQLASAQERLTRIDREIGLAEGERDEFEAVLALAQRETPANAVPSDTKIPALKGRLQAIRDRVTALHQERISTENEMGPLRRDARDWQELLDKAITGGT